MLTASNKHQHCTFIWLLQERLIRTIHIMTGSKCLLLSHLKCHQGGSNQIYYFTFYPTCSYLGEIIMHLMYQLSFLMSIYIVNSYDSYCLLLFAMHNSSGLNYKLLKLIKNLHYLLSPDQKNAPRQLQQDQMSHIPTAVYSKRLNSLEKAIKDVPKRLGQEVKRVPMQQPVNLKVP